MSDGFATCSGPYAHAGVLEGKCPRCGQYIFLRRVLESDAAFRARIKAALPPTLVRCEKHDTVHDPSEEPCWGCEKEKAKP